MDSYYSIPGVDTGVHSTANSANVLANVRVRLAVGGEAGIVVEQETESASPPWFVAIYFRADDLTALIDHLQAMRAEYQLKR